MRIMKYVFIGNRMAVLNEMLLMGLDVQILPIPKSKIELFRNIYLADFDILVSNGCPYILPVSKIRWPHQLFINIHPSLLPDLKGKSPILEAIKFKRPMGATCHLMEDKVDSGAIISQIKFEPDRKDLNDCYGKAFEAEVEVFKIAFKRSFKPL